MWFAFTSLHLCMSWLYWKRSALVSLWFYMSKYLSFNTWPHSMGEQSPRSKGWSVVGASNETPGEQSEVKSLSSICAQNYCLQCCWWSEHARKRQCPQISSHLSSYVWLAILASAFSSPSLHSGKALEAQGCGLVYPTSQPTRPRSHCSVPGNPATSCCCFSAACPIVQWRTHGHNRLQGWCSSDLNGAAICCLRLGWFRTTCSSLRVCKLLA